MKLPDFFGIGTVIMRANIGGAQVKEVLRRLNFLIGAAMIVAGLLLAQIPWIHIAQPPASDAFHLIQFHFVLTGLVSIWATVEAERAGALISASLLLLGVNAWFVFLGLRSGDVHNYWPLALAAASSFNFCYLLATDQPSGSSIQSAGSNEEKPAANEEDQGLVVPGYGAVKNGAYLKLASIKLAILALSTAFMLFFIFIGSLYIRLLNAVIGKGAEIDLGWLLKYLLSDSGKENLTILGFYVLVVVVIFGSVFVMEAISDTIWRREKRAKAPDIDRELSREERNYIRDSFAQLVAYLKGRKYGGNVRGAYVFGATLAMAGFFLLPVAVVIAEWLINGKLEILRAGDTPLIYYSGVVYFGGVAFSALAGGTVVWSLFQWLGARWPELGEYMFARAGWNSMNNRPRTSEELLCVLVRHVRAHMLRIEEAFGPREFLSAAFGERASFIYKATIILSLLTMFFTAADLAHFKLVDENGVSYSKYFRVGSHHVAFEQIDRVELRCNLFRPDKDTGAANLGVSYILVKEGEFRIDLLSNETIQTKLPEIRSLDARLAAANVSFLRSATAGFLQGDRASFVPNCAEEIRKRYSPDTAKKLERLLRVGEKLPSAHS